MKNNNFISLIILYVGYAWFMKIGGAIVPAYLHQAGTSINNLFIANAIQFLPMVVILVFVRMRSAKAAWRASLIFGLLSFVTIINIQSQYQVYLTYLLGGASLALFFVYYNIGHFLYTPKGKTGTSGALMYAISPSISIVAPLLAGTLAVNNINYLWLLALISFGVAFALTYRQSDFVVDYTLTKTLDAIKSTRVPIFIEGVWESVLFAIIPVLTLNFISDIGNYGRYLAYLSLIGTIAGLILGRYTDKYGKRSYLLVPISIILSILTLALIIGQQSLIAWVIITSLIQMVIPIFWNIMTALVVDQGEDLKIVFPGREITLATGRLIGLSCTAYLVSIGQVNIALILLSLVILTLPAYLHYQSKVLNQFHYL